VVRARVVRARVEVEARSSPVTVAMNRLDVLSGISAPASAAARARPGDRLVPAIPSRASSGEAVLAGAAVVVGVSLAGGADLVPCC
jgi:hypothetical protein